MTEIRASDHIQPNSMVSLAMFKPMLAGKRVVSPVPVDVPRTWTSVRDSARLLTTVANDERAFGKAWHVPSYEPMTAREVYGFPKGDFRRACADHDAGAVLNCCASHSL
ncbi:hypothetical protein [Bradyrhizobium sp. WSM2254]|uniref:hypothetical protein n=1 Tax=Bradyrhizobium sp. WSM2254 TaxID=1188263 RepID=UPI0003FF4E64|nr:hypothetical protein [Bradyrhizobium sp. WSM2254]